MGVPPDLLRQEAGEALGANSEAVHRPRRGIRRRRCGPGPTLTVAHHAFELTLPCTVIPVGSRQNYPHPDPGAGCRTRVRRAARLSGVRIQASECRRRCRGLLRPVRRTRSRGNRRRYFPILCSIFLSRLTSFIGVAFNRLESSGQIAQYIFAASVRTRSAGNSPLALLLELGGVLAPCPTRPGRCAACSCANASSPRRDPEP